MRPGVYSQSTRATSSRGGETKSARGSTSARGRADLLADGGEGAVGVLAQRGDRGEADHDDQSQHDRVLDGRWAIFTLNEIHNRFGELTHGCFSLRKNDGKVRKRPEDSGGPRPG